MSKEEVKKSASCTRMASKPTVAKKRYEPDAYEAHFRGIQKFLIFRHRVRFNLQRTSR